MEAPREGGLLAWQWHHYPSGHRDRRNLLVHLVTEPLFLAGTLAVATSPLAGWRNAVGGLVVMVLVMAIQGRTHKLEQTKPIPFRGPGEFVARIFLEQWVTFPRYVLTGGLLRAWREAKP